MKRALSAFIITFNEEKRLERTLSALAGWVDDIVVVDSGSTDRTVEIAKSHGARVFDRIWTGYGPQKRFAEEQCKHQWVLNVDADEVITDDLAAEIQDLFAHGAPEAAAYKIRILNVYAGQSKPRLWANDYNVVRLYHRCVGRYRDHPVFDRVELQDVMPKQLHAPIHHFPYTSITHIVDKAISYSEFRASQSKERSRLMLKLRLIAEFPVVFLKSYIGRRHFTGGWQGLYFSICNAFLRTTRIARMLETQAVRREKSLAQLSLVQE